MFNIPFTQYLMPDGRKRDVSISRPKEIYDKVLDIIDAGYRFEAEVLTTGQVSLTITGKDEDVDIEVVENGPKVPLAVDNMVNRFWEAVKGDKNV